MPGMTDGDMLASVDAELLGQAFPAALRDTASRTAERILRHLHRRQWTDHFQVNVGSETVSIPYRLHFSSTVPAASESDEGHLVGKCLESRSNDGFHRQRAVRELLADVRPWTAPFITALIGEYLIEILRDIHAALDPRSAAVLAEFISANPGYWRTVRHRVTSYWDVYYRADFRRGDYVGFRLIDVLEDAVRVRGA